MTIYNLFPLFTAILAGAIVYLFTRMLFTSKVVSLEQRLLSSEQQFIQSQDDLRKLQKEKEHLLSVATKYQVELEQSKLSNQKLEEQTSAIKEQLQLTFQQQANEILSKNSQDLIAQNKERLEILLKPFQQEVEGLRKQVVEAYDKEARERHSLTKEIDRLVNTTQLVSKEANNLTTALKGNTKAQGNWGEMVLERLLELSGLEKGREYFTQEFIRDAQGNIIKDDEGRALQPDVTILYPDQRKVIVDSKVSLIAWDQYVACSDIEEQPKHMEQLMRSIRAHVISLSKKEYPKHAQALEQVLMFIPVEPAFLEVLKKDTSLWQFAYEKKVLLVSPTSLISVLRIIADVWRIETQHRRSMDIAKKAGDMYDKLHGFLQSMSIVGKKLQEAQDAHQKALSQLSTGRGNLLNRAQQLKEMGVSTNYQLPEGENE
jgi:DNA recombination protein RmuC